MVSGRDGGTATSRQASAGAPIGRVPRPAARNGPRRLAPVAAKHEGSTPAEVGYAFSRGNTLRALPSKIFCLSAALIAAPST